MIWIMPIWPRVGSTLLMQCVDSLGFPALKDDGDIWPGAWQHQKFMNNPIEILKPIANSSGVVKTFHTEVSRLQMFGIWPESVLIPTRPYSESKLSWENLGMKMFPEEILLPIHYCLIENFNRKSIPIKEIKFHELIDKPLEIIKEISNFLNINSNSLNEIANLVDPSRRHYKHKISDSTN